MLQALLCHREHAESEVVRVIDLVDIRSNPETLPERLKMQLETKFSLT